MSNRGAVLWYRNLFNQSVRIHTTDDFKSESCHSFKSKGFSFSDKVLEVFCPHTYVKGTVCEILILFQKRIDSFVGVPKLLTFDLYHASELR